MRILQSGWQDSKGLQFHLQAWEPEGRPVAAVALVHGLGEHVARYAPTAQTFVRAGIALMGFDLRGHGRSGGPRGHAPSYDRLLEDIDDLLDRVRSRYSGCPVFLYGHSLGGGLVLNYALRRRPELKGAICTSPWIRTVVEASPLQALLVGVVDPVLPAFAQRWGLTGKTLSRDPEVVRAFDNDPLAHGLISVRMYRECVRAGAWALEHASDFPLPLLLMHGSADPLTSWEASREFARRLGKSCTLRLWEGWYHELHNEKGSGRAMRTMIAWMNGRLTGQARSSSRAGQKGGGMRKSRPILRRRA